MKPGLLLRLGALVGTASLVEAECPNACSGHGTCGAYDMCSCYSGYMGNDCSERVCPFGLAHVDSPKGDLDMDNNVEYQTVAEGSQMYKAGTSELFPLMVTANGTNLVETAHYYMECSNKGLCDRTSATCECFTGYEGNSCQRASCPNECSGHGVCKTNRELASGDHSNIYELWDADMSLACDCDAGYGTYDCSERICPYGIDPLFIDDENTARVASWTLHFEDALGISGAEGTWRLKLYDVFGEDWITEPLTLNTTCDLLTEELVGIPNDVVDEGTVDCVQDATVTISKFLVAFTGNPGYLKVPEIITLDESGRYTLKRATSDAYEGLDTTAVYDTGVTGEFYDYFGKKCGVTVTAHDFAYNVSGNVQTATVTTGTDRLLKECLGDSNDVTADNVGVENWDFGGVLTSGSYAAPGQYPHLVKLVNSAASSEFEGGVFAIMFWNSANETFTLSSAVETSVEYRVFATDGVLERVWYDTNRDGQFSITGDDLGLAYWTQYTDTIYTSYDFSCEKAGDVTVDGVFFGNDSHLFNNCLEKGDYLVIPASASGISTQFVTGDIEVGTTWTRAQDTLNSAGLYEIMKISAEDYTATTNITEDRYQIVLDRPIFWDGSATATVTNNTQETGIRQFYRFTPNMVSNVEEWVAPCSNRGLCDDDTGLCTCFAGYTNQNCDTQSALAV